MAQPQPQQIPDLDIKNPQTIFIRIALIRNTLRQIDDELTGYMAEIMRQLQVAQKAQAEAERIARAEIAKVEAAKKTAESPKPVERVEPRGKSQK